MICPGTGGIRVMESFIVSYSFVAFGFNKQVRLTNILGRVVSGTIDPCHRRFLTQNSGVIDIFW